MMRNSHKFYALFLVILMFAVTPLSSLGVKAVKAVEAKKFYIKVNSGFVNAVNLELKGDKRSYTGVVSGGSGVYGGG